MTTEVDPIEPVDSRLTLESRVAYLETACQLADRSLAQFVDAHRSDLYDLQVANLDNVGFQLRRALDVANGHGGSLAPCWCRRHWRPDVPIRV